MLVVLAVSLFLFLDTDLQIIRNGTIKSTTEIIRTLNDASLDPKTGISPTPRDYIDRT